MPPKQSVPFLYVFLDESGDFNFTQTGTRFFIITAVTVVRPFSLETPLVSLKYDLIEQGAKIHCFHATEDFQKVRNEVFSVIATELRSLRLDSLIIAKARVPEHIQESHKFYPVMIGYLLRHVLQQCDLKQYSEVIVITDSLPLKRKRESFEKGIKLTLSEMLPLETRYRVLHHPSASCANLQIADYCNWAVFKKWERGDLRSYTIIQPALRSELEYSSETSG